MEQMSLSNMTQDERGRFSPAPDWMDEERCENCKHWTWLPKAYDQPEGWGVKGACARHRGQSVGKNSYCSEFKNKWG